MGHGEKTVSSRDPVQITKNGGWVYQESTDGRFLYYARARNERGIWRVPTQGGEEIPILDQVPPECQRSWAVRKRVDAQVFSIPILQGFRFIFTALALDKNATDACYPLLHDLAF